jgi:hypothetical protein
MARRTDGRRAADVPRTHARAGDKGITSDLSLIAYRPEDYALIRRHVTAERVRAHFADIVDGPVDRYELPLLHALKFVPRGALGDGVTRSLNLDAHGKTLSSCLLEMTLPRRPARRAEPGTPGYDKKV